MAIYPRFKALVLYKVLAKYEFLNLILFNYYKEIKRPLQQTGNINGVVQNLGFLGQWVRLQLELIKVVSANS